MQTPLRDLRVVLTGIAVLGVLPLLCSCQDATAESPVNKASQVGQKEPAPIAEVIPPAPSGLDQPKRPQSALVPSESEKKITAGVDATEVNVDFEFTNTSDQPIRIANFDSNCSCLSAVADKRVIAPGQKGVLKTVFDLGDRAGIHRKAVHMTTTEPGSPVIAFTVQVEIPEVVVITPGVLKWDVGGPATMQKLKVEMVGEDPIKITTVDLTRPDHFKTEIKEIKEGRQYEIEITPVTTSGVAIGMVRILTDSKISKYQRRSGFVQITRPKK